MKRHDAMRVWVLAEEGAQYLVFASHGESFGLMLRKGEYIDNVWIDSKTGKHVKAMPVTVSEEQKEPVMFEPPGKDTDWVLVLRSKGR